MLRQLHSVSAWFRQDARFFQIVSQLTFLTYGLLVLGWEGDQLKYFGAFAGAVGTQALFIATGNAPAHSLRSALITTLGLCLLLKANSPWIFFFAGSVAIAQKFAFRWNGKHLWNPAAFGIVLAILLSGNAWISPGQWGSAAVLVFVIGSAGLAVLSRVRRLDTGLVFILTLAGLEFSRTILYLGWDYEVLWHKLSSGSLWLFAFFMITDPMTIPMNKYARISWAMTVAGVAFYLSNFQFINAAPIWVLVFATPFSPLIDSFFRGQSFQWISTQTHTLTHSLKTMSMKNFLLAVAMGFALLAAHTSSAFCGFYVAKADATLFNNKSEVILVRDGLRTVITMSSDFKGDVRDFAMVVPVPVVLKRSDIKVVNRSIFEKLDAYSSPRLVEYYDSNPCHGFLINARCLSIGESTMKPSSVEALSDEEKDFGVTIEARYSVGEYDILLLSANESSGLRDWLLQNEYKIPEGADEILAPYIKSNTKFFVVKVNLERLLASGFDYLNPLQISFEHEKFMLPIRLGMANSTGTQDMIVYAFTRSGRVECTNYRTVKMPSDRNVPIFVREEFGDFYKTLFEKTYRNEGRNAVLLEYAWNVSPSFAGMKCDPCVGPPPIYQDFSEAGVWWVSADWNNPGNVFFTRLHVRYGKDKFPSDLTFQVTPNNENYQARYVLNHPASGPFDCDEAQSYLDGLRDRRTIEMDELYALTGKNDSRSWSYIHAYDQYMKTKEIKKSETPQPDKKGKTRGGPNPDSYEPTGQTFDRPKELRSDDQMIQSASIVPSIPSKGNSSNLLVSGLFVLASMLILWVSRVRQNKDI